MAPMSCRLLSLRKQVKGHPWTMFYKGEGTKIKTDFLHEPHLNHSNQLASCIIYPFVLNRIFLSHGAKRQQDKLKILPLGGTGRDFETMAHPVKRQVDKAGVRESQIRNFWTTLSIDVPSLCCLMVPAGVARNNNSICTLSFLLSVSFWKCQKCVTA